MSKRTYIRALVLDMLPSFVMKRIKTYADNKKMEHWKECYKVKVSREEVDELFREMAIDGDVMIHSSLPEIGNVKLRDIIDNLQNAVTSKGYTILCPALPVKGSSLDYLSSITTFDVRKASNAMGAISLHYGKQKDALRSLSPTHSVVAYGNKAAYYTSEHHLDETPFTEKSPYFKLLLKKGKILMFGASLKHLTFCHVLEDMIGEELFPLNVYDKRRYSVELIDEAGRVFQGTFRTHSRKSGRMRGSEELMERERHLTSTKIFQLGCGEVIMLDAREVMLCLLEGLKSGVTTVGKRKVSEACKKKAEDWIEYINQL